MKDAKKILIYIKYPYTAIIIAIMWLCIIAIITKQHGENLEYLLILTSIVTVYLAYKGFKPLK